MGEATGTFRILDAHWEQVDVFPPMGPDNWPQGFIRQLIASLEPVGVTLRDLSFEKDPVTLADVNLLVNIRRWNATARIYLDRAVFFVADVNWETAHEWTPLFEQISEMARGSALPSLRQANLFFHVSMDSPGVLNANLVMGGRLGPADAFGVSRYRSRDSLTIDRSNRHAGAALVQIRREFPGDVTMAKVVSDVLADQSEALGLMGLAALT